MVSLAKSASLIIFSYFALEARQIEIAGVLTVGEIWCDFSEKYEKRSFYLASVILVCDATSMHSVAVSWFYTNADMATSLDRGSPNVHPSKIGLSLGTMKLSY
jgi:hypothetical protein